MLQWHRNTGLCCYDETRISAVFSMQLAMHNNSRCFMLPSVAMGAGKQLQQQLQVQH
jgi:hypothetical protein